jgi:hypothetical protein
MQDQRASEVLSLSHARTLVAELLGGLVQSYGMVRHVLVKVGEHEQQFEHPIPVLRLRVARFLFEVLNDGKRVRQEPFDVRRVYRPPLAAAAESLVGTDECVVQEMLEAESLVGQSRWNRIRTAGTPAACRDTRIHDKPQSPKRSFLRPVRQSLPQVFLEGGSIRGTIR